MAGIFALTPTQALQSALQSKLDSAAKSLSKGQVNAAVNQLGAFINQVQAQRGKKHCPELAEGIKTEVADAMILHAQVIIASLSPYTAPSLSLPPTPLGSITKSV